MCGLDQNGMCPWMAMKGSNVSQSYQSNTPGQPASLDANLGPSASSGYASMPQQQINSYMGPNGGNQTYNGSANPADSYTQDNAGSSYLSNTADSNASASYAGGPAQQNAGAPQAQAYMPGARGPSGPSSPRAAYMAGKGSVGSPQASYTGKATPSGGLPAKEADYKPGEPETKKAANTAERDSADASPLRGSGEKEVKIETDADEEKEVKAKGKHVIETDDEADDEEIYFCEQHKRDEYEGTHEAMKKDKNRKS